MSLVVWKHACLLCSLMALFVFTKERGCWESQWREHGCCVQNTSRKGDTVLFLWASRIQRLGPFAALIKPLFFKIFLLELNPDHYGVLFSTFFVGFVVFLGNWAVTQIMSLTSMENMVDRWYGKKFCPIQLVNCELVIVNIIHNHMYIHNLLHLFMIPINAYFRLRQLIQWNYVQIICFAVIYHSFQMSQLNRLHQALTCRMEYKISLRSTSKGSFQRIN